MHDTQRLSESVKALTKAYNLSVTQKLPSTTEINSLYRKAKRLLWSFDEETRRIKESTHYKLLSQSVKHYYASEVHLNTSTGKMLNSKNKDECEALMGYIDRILESDAVGRKKEIPEYFLGKVESIMIKSLCLDFFGSDD